MKLTIALKIYKISSSTFNSDAINNLKISDNQIFLSASWFTFEIVLIKNAFSKTNETIFSNRNFSEFIISSIIRSKTITAFDFSRLKNKKLVKVKEVTIEAVFNRKNWIFLSNFKNFYEVKEKSIALNIDVFNFEIDVFNSIVVVSFFVFNKLSTYSRLKKVFVWEFSINLYFYIILLIQILVTFLN